MEKLKYTPGPWVIDQNSLEPGYCEAITSFGGSVLVAQAYADHRERMEHADDEEISEPTELSANARLIAAAPKMLELNRKLTSWILDNVPNDQKPDGLLNLANQIEEELETQND